jgi:probable rRNA maturation factor
MTIMNRVKQDQDIVVQIAKNFRDIKVHLPKLKKLVRTVCNRFKLSKATVSIAIVDDAEIRRLNKRFLNRNSTTDCLSFDLSDDDANMPVISALRTGVKKRKTKDENRKLFELVVNAESAVKEAKLRGHSSEAELALYITHGLLHNLGFDDSQRTKAKKMHKTEDEILQQLGFGLVYNKNDR